MQSCLINYPWAELLAYFGLQHSKLFPFACHRQGCGATYTMRSDHGKLELIYTSRKLLLRPAQTRNPPRPAGRIKQKNPKSVSYWGASFHPGNLLFARLRDKKRGNKAAGAPQRLAPVLPGGQRLLTCLMVGFPSSIQPAGSCSHCAAVGRAEIHQVSHRKQLPPPSALLPLYY